LLVVTIVAALFAFGALWYLRPGTPSYILDEAKDRQSVPLLEITEPAKRAPEVSLTDDEIARLANKVAPKVKEQLAGDDDFIATVSDKVEVALKKHIDEQINSVLKPQLEAELKTEMDGFVSKENLSAYLPQLVDALLPDVVKGVYDLLKADSDKYVKQIAQQINLPEDEVLKLYQANRSALIKDLAPSILDAIEQDARMKLVPVAPRVHSLKVTVVPQQVYNQRNAVVEAVPATSAESGTAATSETVSPAASSDGTILLDPAQYKTQRDEIRTNAIQDILDKIESTGK
jgi:hypothetical protein